MILESKNIVIFKDAPFSSSLDWVKDWEPTEQLDYTVKKVNGVPCAIFPHHTFETGPDGGKAVTVENAVPLSILYEVNPLSDFNQMKAHQRLIPRPQDPVPAGFHLEYGSAFLGADEGLLLVPDHVVDAMTPDQMTAETLRLARGMAKILGVK